MSLETVSAVDADLARVNAASQQLASALSQENSGSDAKPGEIERGRAAVQVAEANLVQAQAALQAARAAVAAPASPTTPEPPAPNAGSSITDPGGIVV